MKQRITIKQNKAYFSEFAKKFKTEAEGIVDTAITNIEAEASAAAPVDAGFLRSSIVGEAKGLNGQVRVNASYAAYMEFGTGTKVDVPSEWSEYAATFKGQGVGSFEDFKSNLLQWMRNKGIDEKYLYPIMMKILRVGISPQPFLYPAWKTNTIKMMEQMNKITDGIK